MNKIVRSYPVLGSSEDPTKLSLTIKSLLVALIPIVIAVAQYYSVSLNESDLTELVQQITVLVSAGGAIYGIGRKIYYKIKK